MSNLREPSVLVIGAGMTGILMAIKLREAGINKVVILEKSDRIGGTWRENTYPGVACDVPSHMYTYSFEPNPSWSNLFAKGDEIQAYFEHVVEKYNVTPMIRFNEAVEAAHYDNGQWQVRSSAGNDYKVDFLISATGILHHPKRPNIPGLETFAGEVFHTAEWNHDIAIGDGVNVGVIGTGSTAAQCIPELVASGAQVNVFQRTPQWVMPLKDINIRPFVKRCLARWPAINRVSRFFGQVFVEHFFTKAVTGHRIQRYLMEFIVKLNLRLAIKDKLLREKLRPDYRVGCKRLIVNTSFYKAIQKPNAALITEQIERVTEEGIVTKDGETHALDVIVLSTGFDPFSYMRPMNLTGRNNLHIEDAWSKSIKVYRSLLMPEFPNFFLMLGPNTPIGNFSVIAMSEVQCAYILKLIDAWRNSHFDEVEPSLPAVSAFNDYVKAGLSKTAWVGGCQSWYLDAEGDPILWPYTWRRWVDEMREPQMADLITRKVDAQKTPSHAA